MRPAVFFVEEVTVKPTALKGPLPLWFYRWTKKLSPYIVHIVSCHTFKTGALSRCHTTNTLMCGKHWILSPWWQRNSAKRSHETWQVCRWKQNEGWVKRWLSQGCCGIYEGRVHWTMFILSYYRAACNGITFVAMVNRCVQYNGTHDRREVSLAKHVNCIMFNFIHSLHQTAIHIFRSDTVWFFFHYTIHTNLA